MKVGSLEFDLLANVARLQQDMNKAQGVMSRSLGAIEKNVERTMRTFQRFGGMLGVLLGGSIASKIIEMADGWGQYAVRMKFATESAQEYEYAQQRMVRSANETFRSINETREAFINLSPVLRDMGMNLGQSIDAVDAFSGLLVTAGANAQRGEAAMNALSSSLQKGRVDAMAWSTIYTTADGIIEHLATTTGLTTVELRKLGAEGKISAQQLADALLVAYTPVQEQMKEMPYTIRGAFRNLQNSIAEYIGRINDAASASDGAAKFIARMADNVDILMGAMIALSATVIPALIARFTALTVAMAKNPIGLIAVGIATATTYLILLRDEIGEFNKEMDSLGAVWDIVKDAASTAFNAVFDWLKDTLNLADETTSSIGGFFDAAFGGIADGLDSMHGAFIGSMAALGTLIEASANNLKNYFLKAFDSVVDGTVAMVNKMIDGLNLVNPFSDIKHMKGVSRQAGEIVNVFDAMAEASANARKENQLGAKAAYEYRKEARRINREVSELEGWYSELSEEMEKSNKLTKESTVATSANTKATKAAAKAAEEFAKAREAEFNAQRSNISRIHEEAQALEDQVRVFGQGKFALEQLDIARLQEQRTMLSGFRGSEEQIELIEREIDAIERRMAAGTQLEELQEEARVRQEMTDEHIRMNEEIGRTLTDALMRGFEDGKGFAKNMRDTVINMFRTMVLRPIIEPVMQGVAGAITGALGVGGGSGGVMGSLGGVGSLFTNFGGSMAGMVQNLGGSMAGLGGSLGDLGANIIMSADTIGSALDFAGTAFSYAGSIFNLTKGNYGAAAGGAIGTFFGGPVGGFIGNTLGGLVDGLFGGGEKRAGGRWTYDKSSGQSQFYEGPSGGYGGQATTDAMTQVMGTAVNMIDSVFEAVGVQAEVAAYRAMFESSGKGRGGTFSGGTVLIDGQEVSFGTNVKGAGYGSRSATAEQSFEDMTKDMAFSALEAWQLAADQMPSIISDMLSGVDIRALSAEQAEGLAQQISGTVAMVTAFSDALNGLPFENLKGLTFDLSATMLQAFGGIENAMAGLDTYYQNFYSETERAGHVIDSLTSAFSGLGYELPASREAYRDLVESIDVTTESGAQLYAQMIQMSGAFASVIEESEQVAEVIEEVIEEVTYNLNAFYSEFELFSMGARDLAGELQVMQVQLPANRQGFREMLDSIDTTTDAGQEMFNALAATADRANDYYRYVEREAASSLKELEQQVNTSRKAEMDALKVGQDARMDALRSQQKIEQRLLRDTQSAQSKALRDAQASQSKMLSDAQAKRMKALRKAQDERQQAVRDSYAAQRDAISGSISAVNDKLRELESLSSKIAGGLEALRGDSKLATDLHREASKRIVEDATALARAGKSLVGFEQLEDAVNAVSQLDTADFASLFDFELERAESVNELKTLGELTDVQVDVQDLQLEALERQLEQLDEWRDAQLEMLSALSEREQEQMQKLFELEREDLKTKHEEQQNRLQHMHEVEQERAKERHEYQQAHMREVFAKEQEALDKRFDVILEQEKLSLATQVEGMLLLQANQMAASDLAHNDAMAAYGKMDSIENAIGAAASRIASSVSSAVSAAASAARAAAAAASAKKSIPGFATGGRYPGGLAVFGEEGPEIVNFDRPAQVYTNAQSKNLVGGDDKESAGLLRQLLGEIKEMRYETRQVVVNTQKTSNTLDDVTQGGTTLRTEVFNGAN